MLNNVRNVASCFVALSLTVVACGDGDEDEGGAGGGAGKGGSAGATAGSGGSGKGGSAGSSAGKGGSAGSSGSGAGTAGTSGSAGTAGMAGTSGSGGAGSGGEGGEVGGDGGTGTGTGGAGAGEGGVPGVGGAAGSGGVGGDAGGSGDPEGGMGGEPAAGAGGAGTAGEGGAPVSASGGAGGEGGEPGVVWDVIDNPGFEETDSSSVPPRYWTVTGTAGAVTYSWSNTFAHAVQSPEGPGFLDLWLATEYTADVSQVVSPIADGSYTLSIWHYGGAYTEQYVYVSGYDETNAETRLTANTAANSAFVEIRIEDIPVTSGQIKIGIYSVGAAGNWSHFDDVSLTLSPE